MTKKEFFKLMDAPGNSIIPDCPKQERWLNQWVWKQNRMDIADRVFGAKGNKVSRTITSILMFALGIYFFVLAFKTGFLMYLFVALILIAFGWFLIDRNYGKRKV